MTKKKSNLDGYSRRDFLKIGGGATVLGATGMTLPGPQNPTQRGEAAFVSLGLVATAVATAYVVDRVADSHTGDDFDETAYDEAANEESWTGTYEKATEMQYYDDQVFTQINNLLANSEQVAYGDARYRAIEEMNLGSTEADVISAAESVVDEYFATQQKNLVDHWNVQADKLYRMLGTVEGFGNTELDNSSAPAWYTQATDGTKFSYEPVPIGTSTKPSTHNITLVNGNQYGVQPIGQDGSVYLLTLGPDTTSFNHNIDNSTFKVWRMTSFDGLGDHQTIIDVDAYQSLFDDMVTHHSNVISEINTFVTNVYPDYTAGDIDLADVVQPSSIAELAHTEQEDPIAGADLAIMGLKANTKSQMVILLEDSQVLFDGTLYLKSDGTSTSLSSGQTYNPADFSGPVWLAYQEYELTSDSTFDDSGLSATGVVQVEEDFTVISAQDVNGNDLSTVEFTEQDGQDTTTTDISALSEELARLQELQQELQDQQEAIAEDQTDTSSGGGGIDLSQFSAFGIPGEIVAIGVAGLALLGLNSTS